MPRSVFGKSLALLVGTPSLGTRRSKQRPLKSLTERELIQLESEIGGRLFGEIPAGHRREFFNLDTKTWIWHEEWIDEAGKKQQLTTRYEVTDKGILKAQAGPRYTYIEGQELENLQVATQLYHEQVVRAIYRRNPQTGEKLP